MQVGVNFMFCDFYEIAYIFSKIDSLKKYMYN